MPLDEAYVARAEHNRQLLDQFDLKTTPFLDWVVTIAFYTALRWIDAYFSPNKPPNHNARNRRVWEDSRTRPIYTEYLELFNQSQQARYELANFSIADVEQLVANRLGRVEAHMRRQ